MSNDMEAEPNKFSLGSFEVGKFGFKVSRSNEMVQLWSAVIFGAVSCGQLKAVYRSKITDSVLQ